MAVELGIRQGARHAAGGRVDELGGVELRGGGRLATRAVSERDVVSQVADGTRDRLGVNPLDRRPLPPVSERPHNAHWLRRRERDIEAARPGTVGAGRAQPDRVLRLVCR